MSQISIAAGVCLALAILVWPRALVVRKQKWKPSAKLSGRLTVSVAGFALGWFVDDLVGAILGTVIGVALIVSLEKYEQRPAKARQAKIRAQFCASAELLAATLDSGAPMAGALAKVSEVVEQPTSQLLAEVVRHLEIGRDGQQAWQVMDGEPFWQDSAQDIAATASTGAGVAQLLRTHAQDARQVMNNELETKARTVSVKSVLPMMACFLPSFILVGVVPIVAGVLSQGIF